MIRLLEEQDITIISNKYNLDLDYLNALLDNKYEFMYISVNDEIDGYMICLDNGKEILVERIEGDKALFLRYLAFNINKYKNIEPGNIEIFDYYEQDEEFKIQLLEQINEPTWKGAKYLYNNVKNNLVKGKLFIMYDKDNNHIISFCALLDFDEIESHLKPWLGSLFTFLPYRGKRFSEELIKYILRVAKSEGNEYVYLSTNEIGLYEKYGFTFYGMMTTVEGEITQVFVYDTKMIDKTYN